MITKYRLPLKRYKILAHLLNQDNEIYTSYGASTDYQMKYRVNYQDLVNTLSIHPDLYHFPIVELEDYGFMVRGNNIFFDAGLEAGLKSFICDVNIRTLDDRHMSQFQLLDVEPAVSPFRMQSLLFVVPEKPYFQDEILAKMNQDLRKKGYENRVCFTLPEDYVFELRISWEEPDPANAFVEAKAIVANYGRIRSINGLYENYRYLNP